MAPDGKTIFVVGCPGALATEVVRAIEAGSDASFKLLVPPSRVADGKEFAADRGVNVEVLAGDGGRIDFGLSGKDYLDLADRVTTILYLDMPHPFDEGFSPETAPLAAREVIELGLIAPNLEHVVVLSNLDVAGDFDGVFGEMDLDVGQGYTIRGGEERFRAEALYAKFKDALPITIVRTGLLVGEGEGVCPLVNLLMASKPFHRGGSVPSVPLTLVSSAGDLISRLATMPPLETGGAIHLISPCGLSHSDLVEEVRELAHRQVPRSFDLAAGAERVLERGDPRWSTREFNRARGPLATFETTWSRKLIRSLDGEHAELDRDVLERLVELAVEEITGFR